MSNAEKAYLDYKQGMKYKDIAKKYGVSLNTVKSWKRRQWLQYAKGCTPKEVEKVRKVAHKYKDKIQDKVYDLSEAEIATLANDDLTEQQRIFCLNYARTFNATASYQKAYKCGYMSAAANGSRLLKIDKIKEEITRIKREKAAEMLVEPSDIFQKYLEIAFNDVTDYIRFGAEEVPVMSAFGPVETKDDNGNKIMLMKKVNVMIFKESDEVDGTLIGEVKQGKDGASIKLPDRLKALEWLSNHLEMATPEQKAKVELLKAQTRKVSVSITEPDEMEDDGFLEALNGTAAGDWDEEEIGSI